MLRLCVLGSGSSGNSIFIGGEREGILLDAGFSAKGTLARLSEAGIRPDHIKAIVVSHEHNDHVKGAGVVARNLKVPVFMNRETHHAVKDRLGKLPRVEHFATGSAFDACGIEVVSFSIPHDARDTCAFIFRVGGISLAVATDAGYVTWLMERKIAGADYMILESNHDPEMLKAGPYPWELKQRIASRNGHLSNGQCLELVKNVVHANLQGITFAHVSQTNNNPHLVRQMAEEALPGGATPFEVAGQDRPGKIVRVG
ncbi:MAG: MBL fold metallo-hydrolase [Nitrospinae bacterium]|nr:MBL fold metallo-hydrolase [Nitrospinota bacterium]